jgi:translation initiation factor 2 subunit 1
MAMERNLPDVGDLVVATVSRVVDYGAYVKLDEYGDAEGLLHISEISTTWVKNIRMHVREGQKLVLKVLRVNRQKGEVDLSLRRVTGREKTEKMLEWKKTRRIESIIKGASERLKASSEEAEKIKDLIYEKSEVPYSVFEDALERGEEAFTELGVPLEWAKALTEVVKSKVRLEKVRVSATLELNSNRPDGIEAIKSALRSAKKVKKTRGTTIRVYAIGAPRYRIEATSRNIAEAQRVLEQATEEVLKTIINEGGQGRRIG